MKKILLLNKCAALRKIDYNQIINEAASRLTGRLVYPLATNFCCTGVVGAAVELFFNKSNLKPGSEAASGVLLPLCNIVVSESRLPLYNYPRRREKYSPLQLFPADA